MNPLRPSLLASASLFFFFLLLSLLGRADAAANSQMGDQISDLPLFATSTVHCDEMVVLHRWEGNCCSLNVTAGSGCILNVIDGRCKVRGQEWTLDYNSTYDKRPCPPSEYTWQMLGMKSDPNAVVETSGAAMATGTGLALSAGAFVLGSGLLGILVGL